MEGNPKAPDRLNLVNIVTVGIVGALLVWVSIIALQAYYKNTLDEAEYARQVENQDRALRDVQAAQEERLNGLTMRDDAIRKKRVVTLPIERAMELVVDELQRNPNASTVPDMGPQNQPSVEAVPPYKAVSAGGATDAPKEGGETPEGGDAPEGGDGADGGDAPEGGDAPADDGAAAPADDGAAAPADDGAAAPAGDGATAPAGGGGGAAPAGGDAPANPTGDGNP